MKEKLKAAGIRALHTMAQTALGVIGSTVFAEEVNWIAVGSASLLAGIVSILKSVIVGMPETPKTNADGESINGGYDEEDCE
jgi:hypothetical protein